MYLATLDLLRCPYCGGRFEIVTSMFRQIENDRIASGVLGCRCCIFPVVDGIPVLHLQPAAVSARAHVEAARPDAARRTMFGLETDEQAERFEAVVARTTATYRQLVEALGSAFEGGYFLYRFSDPTYIVADAVVRSVAGAVLGGRRALDVCGGSGHLTRSLMSVSSAAPVLADLYFAKVWLARRFTAPACEPVCCDGNAPFPFARGAFGFVMCSDAFQYIWTKRLFVEEMLRVIDDPRSPGAAVINHTHNALTWSPSHGQPLDPQGYSDLFETSPAGVFGEAGLLADVLTGGPLDLSKRDSAAALDSDPALTIIASRHPGVFKAHPFTRPDMPSGELRLNPLYASDRSRDPVRLTLSFPSPDYEEEYAACLRYLPREASIAAAALVALERGDRPPGVDELVQRRVVIDLPKYYY
jgi:uncharacterized protein YbaR (Trm112 family)